MPDVRMQAVSSNKKILHRGIIKPSQLGVTVKTKLDPASIVQEASNIIRKVVPKAFGPRVVEERVVPPVRITLTK